MLFFIPISLSSVSFTSAWSLQPRLPPILTSPMSSLALVTTRSSITSPRVGVLITWLKKLSSMHSRNLLDCLQLAVLLFQQMSSSHTFASCKLLMAACILWVYISSILLVSNMAFLRTIILIIGCCQRDWLAEACAPWTVFLALSFIFAQNHNVDFHY